MDNHISFSDFESLSLSVYRLDYCRMDREFEVLSTTWEHVSLLRSVFLGDGQREMLTEYIASEDRPLIISSLLNLTWIVLPESVSGHTVGLRVLGPFFIDENTSASYAYFSLQQELNGEWQDTLRATLKKAPAVSMQTAEYWAVTALYFLNGSVLAPSDVQHYTSKLSVGRSEVTVDTDQFQQGAGWEIEQLITSDIRNGVMTNSLDLLPKTALNKDGNHRLPAAEADKRKLPLHNMLTIMSRAAVEGGLPRKTSYNICAEYRKKLDKCQTLNESSLLVRNALLDYIQRVHNTKKYVHCSAPIRLCCEYVETHLSERLSLEELAQKAGYSKYHFSRKFQSETGMNLSTFINTAKMERAKYLLSNKSISIEEVSAEIGMNSRSTFSNAFKNFTGETPSGYRKNNRVI